MARRRVTIFKDVWNLHRSAARFAIACPLLFAVPVAAELVQHAVELQIGMYESFKQFGASESDPARTAAGFVKTLALILPAYWFVRYLGHGDSAAAGRSFDRRSLRLFALVTLWALAWMLPFMFGGDVLVAAGMSKSAVFKVGTGAFLLSIVLETFLAPWKTAAPLGNAAIGFGRSIGLVRGHLLWSLGVFVLAFLPLMVVHYGLAVLAIGRPLPLVATILVADALLVGVLANVLVGINYLVARRVTAAAGVALLPEAGAREEVGTQARAVLTPAG